MTASSDSLDLTLGAPATVRLGETVRFTLRLANFGDRPRDLYLRGRTLTFDIEVTQSDGTVVWRRLEGEMIPAIVHLRTLAPGERIELSADWDPRTARGRLSPGVFTARGRLLVEGDALDTPPVTFRIIAP